jgi:hypothetical protein
MGIGCRTIDAHDAYDGQRDQRKGSGAGDNDAERSIPKDQGRWTSHEAPPTPPWAAVGIG